MPRAETFKEDTFLTTVFLYLYQSRLGQLYCLLLGSRLMLPIILSIAGGHVVYLSIKRAALLEAFHEGFHYHLLAVKLFQLVGVQ